MSGGVLASIVSRVRERIAAGDYAGEPGSPAEGGRLADALAGAGTRIIAEIKRRSPSAGPLLEDADRRVEELADAYARGGAAALSVVTERDFFGGDPAWVLRAGRASGLPVLMKDFFVEESQLDFAAQCGADGVLLIAALVPEEGLARLLAGARARGLSALVEAHGAPEIERAVACGARLIGVNARDLRDFSVDREGAALLARRVPSDAIAVAESGIRSRADVERLAGAGFSAFLVGEALLRAPDPAAMLRGLRGAP